MPYCRCATRRCAHARRCVPIGTRIVPSAYKVMSASLSSRVRAFSGLSSQSVQCWNPSTSQAAKPTGESMSPKESVVGLVPWIY
jgi:hypothetical protein